MCVFSVRFPRSHYTGSTVIRILEMYVLVWCRIFISKCLGHFLPEILYWLVLLSWATGPIELLRRVYKSQYGCRWCAGDIGSQFACIIFYCSPKTNYRNQEPITILYSMDCVTTAWLMVLSHKGSLILHCVTVAAATPSLHTQSRKRFLPGVGVWTAWRLRDWCCCHMYRGPWVGESTGCLMSELYSMDCVTTAWLMVLSHKGSLILHCVTVAAATPSLHTQSWKRFLPGVGVWTAWRLRDWCCCAYCLYCIATAWLMQLSHVQRPMSEGCGPASVDTGLRDNCIVWTALLVVLLPNWGYLIRVRDNCVVDAAATPGLHIQSYILYI